MFAHTIKNCQKRHATSMPVIRVVKPPEPEPDREPIEPNGLEILNKLRELSHYVEPETQKPVDWERHEDIDHLNALRLKRTLTADLVKKKTVRFHPDASEAQTPISQPLDQLKPDTPTPSQLPTIPTMQVMAEQATLTPIIETPITETTTKKTTTIKTPIIHKTNPLGIAPAKRGRPRKIPEK
jgi:hypothetical protein